MVCRVEFIDSPKACLSHLLFKFGVSVGQGISRDIVEATKAWLTIATQLQIPRAEAFESKFQGSFSNDSVVIVDAGGDSVVLFAYVRRLALGFD